MSHRQPIRVAIDARYIREKPSGISTYVRALVDRLPYEAPADHFLFWAYHLASRPLSHASNTSEVTVPVVPPAIGPLFWPERYASFAGVDVFHSPHNLMPRNVPCATVVTIHDVMSIERPGLHLQGFERFVKSKYYQQAVWRAIRGATRLIAPTQATADRIGMLDSRAAARTVVIWEAPDEDFKLPRDLGIVRHQASLLTKHSSPYLLLIGANVPSKCHALAIEAFAAAVREPWRLVLLQRRKSGGRLVELAQRLNIIDRVTWLEAVNREDVVTLLQGAGGLLQPSAYEGFGLPVVEAFACGCPVIASDIAPFREITGGGALLFPLNDVGRFAELLRAFTNSAEMRATLRDGSLTQARRFSWDRCARETLDVYRDAASVGH